MPFSVTYPINPGDPLDADKVDQNFTDLENAGNTLETTVEGNLDDSNFSSTAGMYTAYRTVAEVSSAIDSDVTYSAATYIMVGSSVIRLSGFSFDAPGSFVAPPNQLLLNPSDYTITGRTAKLRLRAMVACNGTAPARTFTFGLYPLSVSGGAETLVITLGALVTGSSIAIASPPANSGTIATSADFDVPSAGAYLFGVALSGDPAANNSSTLVAHLQQHWV
jgi:hypothetical protein